MKKILAISAGAIVGSWIALSFQTEYHPTVTIKEPSDKIQFNAYNMDIKEISVDHVKTPVWFVKTKNPTFSMSMKFRNEGKRNFNKTHPAVLTLLLRTLFEGAGEYSASELKEELTYNDISISISSSNDDIFVTCYSVASNFEKTVNLLNKIMNDAHLSADKLEVKKHGLAEGIKQDKFMPKSIAARELDLLIYNKNHQYYVSDDDILNDIEAHSRKDILSVYNQIFAPKDVEITIAGNLAEEDIAKNLNTLFADLNKNKHNDFQTGEQKVELEGEKKEKKKYIPDPQSIVMFAHPGILSNSEDIYAFKFGLRVLGASALSSRFFTEIRDKKGLTYSIGCSLNESDLLSKIVGSASTRPENAESLKESIKEEFQRIKEQGITQEELDYNKTSIMTSSTLVSASSIVSFLEGCRERKIPLSGVNSSLNNYYNLTLEQVNNALRRHLDPEKLVFVTLGCNVMENVQ